MKDEYLNNIPQEKFALVNENKKLRDKELVTKPIGFFKDAMYRFSRNKGSIFGAIVIGVLVLYAIIAPIISPYSVSYNDGYFRFTSPKLFSNEKIDFLDGCTKKTLNENTFLYYYSMGAETGHNAVKRQEYKKNETTNMYTFRLDTYQKAGCVYMAGISQKDYEALQDFQDKTGRQIIYPITDPNKRPTQSQDKSNANYWFETKVDGSVTVPDNYTINEDGTVTFTDIYKPYANQQLVSQKVVAANKMPAIVKASDAGSGEFYLKLSYDYSEYDEEGNLINESMVDEGYICIGRRFDEDFFYFDEELANASKFSYDTTYNALTFNLTGHEDATKDGIYYLSLPYTQGSTVSLRNYANIDTDVNNAEDSSRYLPLGLYNADRQLITAVEFDKTYSLCAVRESGAKVARYVTSLIRDTGFSIQTGSERAVRIGFVTKDDGYRLQAGSGRTATNLLIKINADDTTSFDIGTVTSASTVYFDPTYSAVYAELNGFSDASKNGRYYIANFITAEIVNNKTTYSAEIGLAKLEDITSNEFIDFYHIIDANNVSVTAVDTSSDYRMRAFTDLTSRNYYAVNGEFTGDNYSSKMRVEGEGQYKYSYAIAKAGHAYEIRVNYYEYYRYYHKEVLHDRIDKPFFLFGTTSYGQDIFTCLASGARFSFIMAIVVAVVNMIVGAIYGAMEGYYGGKVDLIMERIVEILSAVPFMIVITLLKYHMHGSSHVLILFIAFFLTGWIGMSGTVRMQFYRFKNQEYVLASRTLGAKDWRIMFKHIFPNALGTIVTSSVLVIPGMIFSETSLSYLGIINLNTGKMTSVGTMLANAQPYLVTYPHMILFPAIFISLLMLCFNLFGNGLRDAFNPSLRGTED